VTGGSGVSRRLMGGSGLSRQAPITAFGGEILCRFAAGVTQPEPLREALSRQTRPSLSNALEGTAHG